MADMAAPPSRMAASFGQAFAAPQYATPTAPDPRLKGYPYLQGRAAFPDDPRVPELHDRFFALWKGQLPPVNQRATFPYVMFNFFEAAGSIVHIHPNDFVDLLDKLASMPPKLINDEGDLLVLRPLAYSAESDIARFANGMQFPIIPCNLCGSQDGLQREEVKRMLQGWEKATPGRLGVMARALGHTRPSHLLDRSLYDFVNLRPAEGGVEVSGEAEEPCGASLAMTAKLFAAE